MYIKTDFVKESDPTTVPLLKRICACIAGKYFIGLVFEFVNGSRCGCIFDDDLNELELTDKNIERYCGTWVDVKSGDYITGIFGYHLRCFWRRDDVSLFMSFFHDEPLFNRMSLELVSDEPFFSYMRRRMSLFHSMTLEFASGRKISFNTECTEDCKGSPFKVNIPSGHTVVDCHLQKTLCLRGLCTFVFTLGPLVHIHQQITQEIAKSLPSSHKEGLLFLLCVFHRIEGTMRQESGSATFPSDVLWEVLGMMVCHDLFSVRDEQRDVDKIEKPQSKRDKAERCKKMKLVESVRDIKMLEKLKPNFHELKRLIPVLQKLTPDFFRHYHLSVSRPAEELAAVIELAAVSSSSSKEVSATLQQIGHLYEQQGEFDGALSFFSRALKIQRMGNKQDYFAIVESLNNMSRIHWYKGETEDMVAVSTDALRHFRKECNNRKKEYVCNDNRRLCNVYSHKNNKRMIRKQCKIKLYQQQARKYKW